MQILLSVFGSAEAVAIACEADKLTWRDVALPYIANSLHYSEGHAYLANDFCISQVQGLGTADVQGKHVLQLHKCSHLHNFSYQHGTWFIVDTGHSRLLQILAGHAEQVLWQASEPWQRHPNSFAITPYGNFVALHNTSTVSQGAIVKVTSAERCERIADAAAPHDLRYCAREQKLWWCSACQGRLESLHLPSGARQTVQLPWQKQWPMFAKSFVFLPGMGILACNSHRRASHAEVILADVQGKFMQSLWLPNKNYYNIVLTSAIT